METKVSNESEKHMLQVKASKTIRGPFKAPPSKENDTMNFAETEEERSAKYWRRSANYWRRSAKKWRQLFDMRGKPLHKSLQKNQKLQDLYESLQEEQKVCNQMLAESRKLVEALKEVLREANEEAAE